MRGITFKVVVEKNEPTKQASGSSGAHKSSRHSTKLVTYAATIILIVGLIVIGLRLYQQKKVANMDPFTTKTHSLVHFRLYYPTKLPIGYHVDKMSVSSPNSGVIVFHLTDANSEHFIYISEEEKPRSFSFKTYYSEFSDQKNIDTKYGTVTIGLVKVNGKGHMELGSLVSNQTWVIVNTATNIPFNQFESIFTSFVVSS